LFANNANEIIYNQDAS